jgi:predicted DNA-binding transcriptional regulator YafY
MSDMQRLYRIKTMIQARKVVPTKDFLHELEISLATFKRDLSYLVDRMQAPIKYDRTAGGYIFTDPKAGEKLEFPGLWFNEKEATALVLMQHLLSNLDQGGLIGNQIEPLMSIVDGLLGREETSSRELRKRIKVFGMSARKNSLENFEEIGNALLNRKRLHLTYYSKDRDDITERDISPQRMIYYRDNWYVDAFCHLRKDLRNFALDSVKKAIMLEEKAHEVQDKTLHDFFADSYGIFSGKVAHTAKLRFTPKKARWVSKETWHGQQKATFDKNGYYILEFGYNQDPELIMEIMKHGAEVEVLEPSELRDKVIEETTKLLKQYKKASSK